ncbi:LOW QUALITY PROTEIN: uncharacterized protein LOC117316166 [Pecten maximus]|uniref:LOW QUALITY PROTEIN: uncharacterized protein LOC117316166 n=1 Tax=Pecten maximus TaxID=6579 RepID=UPI0014587112|nr:LOW QUALITY PROTEIN: uncharacterized protein LOC117316166 [Pecten maximus]
MGKDKNILYLGNLRRDLPLIELKNNLLELFCNYIGVVVDWNDIDIKKGKQAWFAFVDLHDEGEASETLEELASWENRRNLRYNFTYIVQPYESLTVDYKKVKKPRKSKKPKADEHGDEHSLSGSRNNNAVGKDNKDTKSQPTVKQTGETISTNDKKAKQTEKEGEKTNPPKHLKPKTATSSTEGQETARAGVANLSLSENHCSTSTSMTGCPVKASPTATSTTGLVQPTGRHYTFDQYLGTETRSREYKLGSGNYIKKQLNKDVGKYVCGFLNSREAGTLMIGVSDTGHVKGVECSQPQEDKARLDIDMAIKTINPAIFPNMYTVEFVPVLANALPSEPPLFVLEVSMKDLEDTDVLYATCGDVYVRRDGSVQGPLKGAEIQEWTRQVSLPSQIFLQSSQYLY